MLSSDALTAAVIGGIITGAATLLGAVLLRWLDIARGDLKLRRQVIGAINAVLAEMAANNARLKTQVEHQQWIAVEIVLSTSVFRRVELVLAENLNQSVQAKLFEAYSPIEGGDIYDLVATADPLKGVETKRTGLDLNRCAEVIVLIDEASAALRAARDDLKDYQLRKRAWRRLARLRRPLPTRRTPEKLEGTLQQRDRVVRP